MAGRFYPASKQEIITQLEDIYRKEKPLIDAGLAEKKILGSIVPHAGYMFSGYQAVHFFEIIKQSKQQFDTFIIVNPNHTGYGAKIALDDNDFWETPFGKVEIDTDFSNLLGFPKSPDAHKFEHSGEVMLPMLQFFLDYTYKIVPVTLSHQSYDNAKKLASRLFEVNKILKKEICVIASSDFSHFVKPETGRELDAFVVREIMGLNAKGVEKEVRSKDISVCGFGPIMTLIEYSKLLAEKPKVKLLKRGHSGEVSPSDSVVDYISMLFYNEDG